MKHLHLSQRQRSTRSSSRGVALIEALVGMLLFCVGILGLVGLQASMTRAQTVAKFRADAAYLSSELVGVMWADKNNLANYVTAPGSTCADARCAAWVTKIENTLPGGEATVAVATATGSVDMTLTWAPPNEGTRTYALSTAIR